MMNDELKDLESTTFFVHPSAFIIHRSPLLAVGERLIYP
jgi:hypothetical protein